MEHEPVRTLRYRLPHGDSLVVRRLLARDGFAVQGPDRTGARTEMSVRAESEGRVARVHEVMARWAPGATLVGGPVTTVGGRSGRAGPW